jgi:hypothetical protein
LRLAVSAEKFDIHSKKASGGWQLAVGVLNFRVERFPIALYMN